jgi:citrate synthase
VAAALEQAALTELRERRPDRAIETNVEFWAAVMLDFAEVPVEDDARDVHLRAHRRLERHILEQKRSASSSARRRSMSAPGPEARIRRGLGLRISKG